MFARKRYDYYSTTIGEPLVTILYIGLSKDSRLMTLRLFYDYLSGETTTIPAGTLRLLLTSIGYRAKARKEIRREPPMVPRRPPRLCRWTDCRVEGARLQAAGLAPHQVRRVQHLPAIRGQQKQTPPGGHGLRYAAPSYIPYYNRAAVLACTASGVAVVSGIGAGRSGACVRSSAAQVIL